MMAGTGRKLAIAHGSQLPAQCLLGDGDAELLEDPLRQIDQPPTHDAMNRRDRAIFDHPRDGLALGIVELRGLARRFAVKQAVWASRVEPQPPIADDLKSNTAELRRFAARPTVIDDRQSQKPSGLWAVLRLLRKPAELCSVEIPTQGYRNRHGEPPSFATLNQTRAILGIPDESKFQGIGITQAN